MIRGCSSVLVRALACHARGRGFVSHHSRHSFLSFIVLKLFDVCFSYRANETTIRNINLEAREGLITCLLGPSGCGKSTVFKLIAGLEKLDSGTIMFSDNILSEEKNHVEIHKRDIAFIFQESCFFPHQDVLTNISYGIDGKNPENVAEKILYDIGIEHLKYKLPHELSGGQKQLVSLARAIAQNSRVILLDEPCSSLDFTSKMKLRQKIMKILKRLQKIIVLITHDPHEAMSMCDYIYVMQEGKIVQFGTSYEIYHHPQTQYVLNFFGEINTIKKRVEGQKVQTDFGLIPIPSNLPQENEEINICFRFDTIRIDEQNGKIAEIVDVKFLGHYYLNYLTLNGNEYSMSSQMRFKKDQKIRISLDEANLFFF